MVSSLRPTEQSRRLVHIRALSVLLQQQGTASAEQLVVIATRINREAAHETKTVEQYDRIRQGRLERTLELLARKSVALA